MFPLVHYFVNKKIYETDAKLMILGGLWPDLAYGAGVSRNLAHEMGGVFFQWCRENAPAQLPLAQGILGHGISPHCVDWYADEQWKDGPKGWCFQQGKKYEQEVGAATNLGPDYAWWKSHNFAEICCEMLTNELHPELGREILSAIQDTEAREMAAQVLSRYHDCPAEKIIYAFEKGSEIFALIDLSPRNLAEKQKISIETRLHRENHHCDIPAMSQLLQRMCDELRGEYQPFMDELLELCRPVMSQYRE